MSKQSKNYQSSSVHLANQVKKDTTLDHNQKQFEQCQKDIDRKIGEIIRQLPVTLYQDIQYLFKGKRMRSKLMMELTDLLGCSFKKIILPAVGVEVIHTISLIHDDVIDRQEKRRGKSTLHHLYNNRLAVLIGDFLLQSLVKQMNLYSYHKEVIDVLYQKIAELCRGEILQDIPEESSRSEKIEHISKLDKREQYIYMVKQKTGSLFSYSFKVPTLLLLLLAKNKLTNSSQLSTFNKRDKNISKKNYSNFSIKEKCFIDFAEECGYMYGVAFQLADDLADLEEDMSLLLNCSLKGNLSQTKINKNYHKQVKLPTVFERLPSYAILVWIEIDRMSFESYLLQPNRKTLFQKQEKIKEIISAEITKKLDFLRVQSEQIKTYPAHEYYTFLAKKVNELFDD